MPTTSDQQPLLSDSPLGKNSNYIDQYSPSLLYPLPRINKRQEINVPDPLPFYGADHWNAYEISWLNAKGKPIVAMATLSVPCQSPCLIESKSMKLYFNSFNQTHFTDLADVTRRITQDLSHATGAKVDVNLIDINHCHPLTLSTPNGQCIDHLDVTIDTYQPAPELLRTDDKLTNEALYSNLLKSNCLVTGQPDWGSVEVHYSGRKIQPESLLRYLVSFRNHNEFHEQCVERIFMDISNTCQPQKLTVIARYTRRGGLDINPWRTNQPLRTLPDQRFIRQ